MVNVLNKGRCSRCLASKAVIDEVHIKNEQGENTGLVRIRRCQWCLKYNKLCASVAGFVCKEPPMGINAQDFDKFVKGIGEKENADNNI